MMALIHGDIRITVSDPTETKHVTVLEFNTRACGSITNKRQMPFVPIHPPWVTPDSKIHIFMKSEAATAIVYNSASTIMRLDATYRRVGEADKEYEHVIELGDFTSNENIGGANVTPLANIWVRLGTYIIPAGMEICVGRRADGYVHLALSDA